jgi:hypothetical protein
MTNINLFESISYAFILKILNAFQIPVSEFNSETVKKIKDVMVQPETKKYVEEIAQSYSKISEDIIRETTEKIVFVWEDTLKKSGASFMRLLVDIVPVVGSVVLGADSAVGAVAHASEGVNAMLAIIGQALNNIFSKIQLNPEAVNVAPPQMHMRGGYVCKGGYLCRSQTKKCKRRRKPNSHYRSSLHLLQSTH